MSETWDILKKELAIHGVRLLNEEQCEVFTGDGSKIQMPLWQLLVQINRQIKANKDLLFDVWHKAADLLIDLDRAIADDGMVKLFVAAIKDLARFGSIFYQIHQSEVYDIIEEALDRDANTFSRKAIIQIPEMRITIDYVHRLISRQRYMTDLLKFALTGEGNVSNTLIKSAAGVQGPWSNLDVPIRERYFPWAEIDEEVRGRDAEIRGQSRYKMGLMHYQDDEFGEGFYWKEEKNRPYSWEDRKWDSPYPQFDRRMSRYQ
jgi:hypothetical protein